MNWCKIGNLAALSLTLIFAACGGDDKSSSTASEDQSYASKEDLPSCTSSREAEVVSTDDGKIYVCIDDSWQKIDYSENGVDDLPSCTENRDGNIAYLSSKEELVICKNEKWQKKESKDSNDAKQSFSSNSPNSSNGAKKDSLASSSSCSAVQSSSSVQASYNEVKNKSDLGKCDSSKKDLRTLVLADSSYYTCNAKEWKKDETYLGYIIVSDREYLPQCNAGIGKQRAFAKKDSVFFVCDSVKWDAETIDGYVVKSASIMGAAHKGPFKFDSPLLLRELLLRNDSLIYSGRKYVDEISSNKGDFVIPKVKMIYPYAELEVRGLWRNEISGEWSKDSMTLRVLTDLSNRSNVNINLLTHLEYDRAVSLVNKGYSVFAAKKQADHEIMTALGFAETVEHSEDLKTFAKDADPTLMAISLLFIGNRSDSEIQQAIDSFSKDIADDGEWNGENAETLKAEMADWAESFDGTSVSANVKSWNILDIPVYGAALITFWNNAYELGGCAKTRYGVVVQNKIKSSKNYGTHYICEADTWRKATTYEKDTYGWSNGKSGEFKKGDVTDSIYVFNGTKWEFSERETAIGLCQKSNAGVVSVFNNIHYICRDNAWATATVLEYDTYGLTVVEGDVKAGVVNTSYYYIYKDGKWQTATSIEKDLGGCVASREGFVGKSGDFYYICKSKTWASATVLEYDTYGLTGAEGDVKAGVVNKDKYYVYKDGKWHEYVPLSSSSITSKSSSSLVKVSSSSVPEGYVDPSTVVKGTMIDSRDSQIYKTVKIGSQTWMAENLNYKTINSYCYQDDASYCTNYGRLYTWAAAMDSVGEWSTNGKGCGYDKTCSTTYPVRGVCPTGWHLPTKGEFEKLFVAVGGQSTASKILKSKSGWNSSENGMDAYSFSALPAGRRDVKGDYYFEGKATYFWSSTEGNGDYAYYMTLEGFSDDAELWSTNKGYVISVRCLKN